MLSRFNRNNLEFVRFAQFYGFFGILDRGFRKLNQMSEALNILIEFDKDPERHKFTHRALNYLSDLITLYGFLPGVGLELFDRQRYASFIDGNNFSLHRFADLNNILGVVYALPGQFR